MAGPPEAGIAVFVQMALLVAALAGFAILIRALHQAADQKQAARAHAEAVQSSKHRIRTLAERNLMYAVVGQPRASAPGSAPERAASGAPRGHPSSGDGAVRWAPSSVAHAAGPHARSAASASKLDALSLSRSATFPLESDEPSGGSASTRDSSWEDGAPIFRCSEMQGGMCRVFGSVPSETITTTRQVLAAFNYDYSALHRREASYVAGKAHKPAKQ